MTRGIIRGTATVLFRRTASIFGAVIITAVLACTSASSVFATSQLLDGAQDYRDKALGIQLKVPKGWKTKSSETTLINGEKSASVRLLQKHEEVSRLSTALDIRATTLYGFLGIPNRLRPKLTEADIINLYLNLTLKSINGFKVRSVRKGEMGGLPAYVVESSEITNDRYLAFSTSYVVFSGEHIYFLEAWYFPASQDKKTLLDAVTQSIRFIK